MLWPDPAQKPRIAEIRDNLIARISEAEREGWPGEIEGLKISLAGAYDKLAQIDRRARRQPADLGTPVIPASERVCDGLKAGGRGCWLLWTGAPAATATIPPPFQLRTAEQREGPGRCCSPSTSMANGSPFAELRGDKTAPSTTG